MLKLKSISPNTRKIYNESDYYVTIKIVFEKEDSYDGVCYWNAYGKEDSLVQIGLTNPTGAIYKIVSFFHPTIKHQITLDRLIIDANIPEKIGLPLFETYIEKYREGYYHLDEKINFELYVSEKNITIILSTNTVALHIINEPIIFGFDNDNNLCYIHMRNMTLNNEGFLEQI